MPRPLYQALSSLIDARARCIDKAATTEGDQHAHWADMCDMHTDRINDIMKNSAPSGSGIDSGTKLDWDLSEPERLVFDVGYHHMNDGGYYDGWTEHAISVRPSLQFGFTLKISGRNRNKIKDYLHDVYYTWLTQEV